MNQTSTPYTPSCTGWECANCKQWVASGEPHICPTAPTPAANITFVPEFSPLALGRIADAIERIAKALETK
jgi:hypothetical protein